jgi:murein DD-endopeptidase MepM/ murein hydrolase activator NlpD
VGIRIHAYAVPVQKLIPAILGALIIGLAPLSSAQSIETRDHSSDTQTRKTVISKDKKGKACPTRNFWLGAGWGADRGNRSHMGVDMGGKRGAPIYAVEAGRINRTKKQSNGALQIVLRGKSGSMFYYGHMDKVLIKGGQKVKKGQLIGRMGDSGSPGQVHLHFEYWKSGGESAAVNPIKFLKKACKSI